MFANRVLRRIFGSKREGVPDSWRRLRNEKLHKLCVFPDVISVIKSRIKWQEHVWEG
jgi:hypothetical protein